MFKMNKKNVYVIIICFIVLFIVFGCKYAKSVYSKTDEIVEPTEDVVVEEYVNVWTTTNVNIRKEPNIDSEVIGIYYFNIGLTVTYVDDSWAKVKDTEYYIDRYLISESQISYIDCNVPSNNTIKTYMDYKAITSTESNQYKLQQYAYTGEYGIRKVGDRYCVALGSYYTTTIGQYVDIELENGTVIHGILADCKANAHTDSSNQIHMDGSAIEFVVDSDVMDDTIKRMGDYSYINGWDSKVVNIRVYDKVANY